MRITDGTPAQRLVGYVIDVPDAPAPGAGITVTLELTEAHTNRHGSVHGGIVALLLDTACGMQCSFEMDPVGRPPCLTLSLTTSFVAPVVPGRVVATARSDGGGRRVRYLSGVLADADGRTLATASAVMRMV